MAEPQPWDKARAAEALADAQELVCALAVDGTGDGYRHALVDVFDRTVDAAATDEKQRDELAWVLYGLALFGVGALGLAEALGSMTREEALAKIGGGLDQWLG